MKADNITLFEKMPVPKAIITLVIPTIISQIITVIYNMADAFFIGQMNDPNQVAAAILVTPPFVLLTGVANLFGIGGASMISRCLGTGDRDRARRSAAFSIWAAIAVPLVYGIVFYLLRPVVFPILGTDEYTYGHASNYLLWTVTLGGIPTVLSACLAHLVRADGYAKEAGFGIAFGGVLNIVLDPILIFIFKQGVTGAAIATMLSNTVAMLYYIRLIHKNRDKTFIRFSPKHFTLGENIPSEILLVGVPSFMIMLMSTISNVVLNIVVVSYSNQAIAGMGIAKKLDILAFAISSGMSQGVLPLIGYNYAAKNFERMRTAIKTAFIYNVLVAIAGTLLLFFGAVPIVRFFINDAETVAYGQHFLRVICITCPAISITMMVIVIFQAMGQKTQPTILSILRKGSLDIPLMLMMNALAGSMGIPWATPISDTFSMIVAVCLFIPYLKRFRQLPDQTAATEGSNEIE